MSSVVRSAVRRIPGGIETRAAEAVMEVSECRISMEFPPIGLGPF